MTANSQLETLPNDRVQPPIEAIYRIAKQYSRRPGEVDDGHALAFYQLGELPFRLSTAH